MAPEWFQGPRIGALAGEGHDKVEEMEEMEEVDPEGIWP